MDDYPILEMKDVHKAFGSNHVLKGVDFSVYPGEIVGYIGSNGAGKSTTIKIILGILSVVKGEVKLFGETISEDDPSYKRWIGYVPENGELYETLSAQEYFRFIGGLYGLSVEEVDQRGLAMMTALEVGDVYTHQISSYSRGMRQKTLIAASLLHDPDILFWDEPLSGLDANSVQVVKKILAKLKEDGKTIFYSSHIMDTVEKLSDRIILLDNGQVAANGPFEQLQKEADGSLEQLFNQVTGFDESEALADEFMSAMKGAVTNERS